MKTSIQMSDILAAWEELKSIPKPNPTLSLECDLRFDFRGQLEETMAFRAYMAFSESGSGRLVQKFSEEFSHPLDAVQNLKKKCALKIKDIWGLM